MKIKYGDILECTDGVIIHQVNCQSKIGAGISKYIIEKYPVVEHEYYKYIETSKSVDEVYGSFNIINVTKDLKIVNSYSQKYYGNSAKTGVKYTNEEYLLDNINSISELFYNRKIYIPWRIGCGLAGGDWETILENIKDIPNLIVVALGECSNEVEYFSNKMNLEVVNE